MTHSNECMIWETQPAGDDGWHDCTCQVFNSQSDHDPLCYIAEGKWDGGCNCDFIAKGRADERQRILPRPETDDLCPYSGFTVPKCKSWLCDCFEFEDKWGVSQK